MAEPSASPLPWLMDELMEEILLRLPPQEPASLVRATLVCKPWRRLISGPGFWRRFREFHRPRYWDSSATTRATSAAAAWCAQRPPPPPRCNTPPDPASTRWKRATAVSSSGYRNPHIERILAVWDPITDVWQDLPFLPREATSCTTAILCAAGAGACDHHDWHLGSFIVIFVGTDPGNMFVCTYDSTDYFAVWSKPITVQHPTDCYIYSAGRSPAVLLGNQLYFGIRRTNTALQYDFELHKISWIQLPTLPYIYQRYMLTTTEDDLGVVSLSDGKLCMWLRMDTPEANAGWTQIKAIDLGRRWLHQTSVIGFADGLNIVFATVYGELVIHST